MKVRRWLGAGAALVVGAALFAQPPVAEASAFAASITASDTVEATGADFACRNSVSMSGARPGTVSFPADGVTREYRLGRSGTAGSSDVRTAASVRGGVATNAWGTTRATVKAGASVSARPQGPTSCTVSAAATGILAVRVVAPRTSWLVVRSSAKLAGADPALGIESDNGAVRLQVAPGRALTRLVPASTYTLVGGLTASVQVRTTAPQAEQGSLDASLALYPIGTLRKHTGTGKRFITAGNRDCARKRVDLALSARAHKKARRITLTLDGKRVKVLTGRSLQRAVVRVKRIPAKSGGVIGATVVLKSGAVRRMKASSWPCA
jgi:hypothetical protein